MTRASFRRVVAIAGVAARRVHCTAGTSVAATAIDVSQVERTQSRITMQLPRPHADAASPSRKHLEELNRYEKRARDSSIWC
ncbi:hypothetical protein IscW_ISCW011581 [Ixodes scapularis]|uniref:Uncharacterized protein n=1 Tax=Ixodes scapularis TaxID=6945 RepID=B7Q6E9_IXOSC|nr:hypothetical protein IscW_ISCW011581 [Ixodes scapularis]|eukprot:XP_002411952.1 hypothetical protein IscW_ISCW011581 [Ixodes scapularis]